MALTIAQAHALQAEPQIQSYFEGFNAGNFEAVSNLFAAEGVLQAPFESAIVGKPDILAYLQREAAGMQANPQEMSCETLVDGRRQVVVKGRAKAILFTVNVAWTFLINQSQQLDRVEVKLLASLQELVNFRPSMA